MRPDQAVSPECLILEYCFLFSVFNDEDQKRGPVNAPNGSEKQRPVLNQAGVQNPQEA